MHSLEWNRLHGSRSRGLHTLNIVVTFEKHNHHYLYFSLISLHFSFKSTSINCRLDNTIWVKSSNQVIVLVGTITHFITLLLDTVRALAEDIYITGKTLSVSLAWLTRLAAYPQALLNLPAEKILGN